MAVIPFYMTEVAFALEDQASSRRAMLCAHWEHKSGACQLDWEACRICRIFPVRPLPKREPLS